MSGAGLFITLDTLTPLIVITAENFMDGVKDTAVDYAQDILDYAQANAPWADRTGDARDGLDVDVDENGNEITITLYHTVDYGLWLEVIQTGRFAIIMPTLEHFATPLFNDVGAIPTGVDLG